MQQQNVRKGMVLREKRILVMGLGLHGGGAGTVEFLARHGAKIAVTDLRTARELAPTLKTLKYIKGIRYILGRHRVSDFRAADLIIKNPGVRRDNSYLQDAARHDVPTTSDVGIFFDLCPGRIIGITGTRGKSTTTYLIWRMLKTKFRRVHYGGNIRRSVLTLLPAIKKGDFIVLELSSFQLQDLEAEKKSPHIAVLTNLLRDHLNWHRDAREYREAKSAIFRWQKPSDYLFYNGEDAGVRRMASHARSRVMAAPPLAARLRAVIDQNLGAHYRISAGLAVAVARHFGVSDAAIEKTLRAFKGLEARQETIAVIRGIHFINDTTATTPDATIAAIKRFRALAGSRHKLILIAGGSDKKLDFTEIARAIRQSIDELIFLPGTATLQLKKELMKRHAQRVRPETINSFLRDDRHKNVSLDTADQENIYDVTSMKDAVRVANKLAHKGDYIVLSPGAASFGLFLNEFDRGAQFVKAVKKLKP